MSKYPDLQVQLPSDSNKKLLRMEQTKQVVTLLSIATTDAHPIP